MINASMMGRREVVELPLANGANLNVRDEHYGDTALIPAIIMGRVEIVRIPIERCADPYIIDEYAYGAGLTALEWAKGRNYRRYGKSYRAGHCEYSRFWCGICVPEVKQKVSGK